MPAGRRRVTLLAPPDSRTGTMPTGAGSVISMSLAPPVTSRRSPAGARRSATSFHMPPRSEMSHGTAAAEREVGGLGAPVEGAEAPALLHGDDAAADGDLGGRALEGRPVQLGQGAGRRSGCTLAAPLVNSRRPAVTPSSGAWLCTSAAPSAAASPPRRRLGGERRDLPLVHAARAAQVVADHGQLPGRAILEEAAASRARPRPGRGRRSRASRPWRRRARGGGRPGRRPGWRSRRARGGRAPS